MAGCRAEFLLPSSHLLGSGTCGRSIGIRSTYHHPPDRSGYSVEIDGPRRVISNNPAGMHVGNPGCHCSNNCHILKGLWIWLWGYWHIQTSHHSHKTSWQSRRPYQHRCPAGGNVGSVVTLGSRMGNRVSTIQGKGWALPHGLNTTFGRWVSLGTGIASCLSTGELRTRLNKVVKGGWSTFLGWFISSPSKMSLTLMCMNLPTASCSSLTLLARG